MKQPFDPQDWLTNDHVPPSGDSSRRTSVPTPFPSTPDMASEVDTIITRIEAELTDITTSYTDWLNVGFAFAHEFGESGRKDYHRVCRFNHGYTRAATDRQYDHCLKAKGHGITIRTFFHMAREAGIDVRSGGKYGSEPCSVIRPVTPSSPHPLTSSGESSEPYSANSPHSPSPSEEEPPAKEPPPMVVLPTLPDSMFDTLPLFLQRVVQRCTSREERDILLLGSLTAMSSCLYQVYGIYDDKKVFPNLYLYVTAKASAGKGRLVLCKKLVQPIHRMLREQSYEAQQQYETDMREYNLVKNKDLDAGKPKKPPELLLLIPANSSATGVFQLLGDNKGRGLIFETEGDTLAQAFKSDYGNYSDGFRKAYHHETITYYRRTDREYVEILFPCLSTLLSGTPLQVAQLIPNAENGLFSRFMFYYMNMNPVWKNVFTRQGDHSLDEHFSVLGKEFYKLFTSMEEGGEREFCLTPGQQEEFHHFFTQVHEKYLLLQGVDYLATIRRLGLNAFRICMILSALRQMETGNFTGPMTCRDDDFQAALSMIRILVRHASHVYAELPGEVKQAKPKNKQEQLLERLPLSFTHKELTELAKELSIQQRTAALYMTNFCNKGLVIREQRGFYTNVSHPDYHQPEDEKG